MGASVTRVAGPQFVRDGAPLVRLGRTVGEESVSPDLPGSRLGHLYRVEANRPVLSGDAPLRRPRWRRIDARSAKVRWQCSQCWVPVLWQTRQRRGASRRRHQRFGSGGLKHHSHAGVVEHGRGERDRPGDEQSCRAHHATTMRLDTAGRHVQTDRLPCRSASPLERSGRGRPACTVRLALAAPS